MPKQSDIWIPESLLQNGFFKLSPIQMKIMLHYYSKDDSDVFKLICAPTTLKRNKFQEYYDDLFYNKKMFINRDGIWIPLYENRKSKKQYIKAGGKEDNWDSYIKSTKENNPVRMRKETYEYIMNNNISKVEIKLIFLILRAYAKQYREDIEWKLKDILKFMSMSVNPGLMKPKLEEALISIQKNMPNEYIKSYEFSGGRGSSPTKLKIRIR